MALFPPVITNPDEILGVALLVRNENSRTVVDVDATVLFEPDPALTYSISGADSALFNIDPVTGVVTFIAAPDFETPRDDGRSNDYRLTVTVTNDDDGQSESVNLSVVVSNVNEAPIITSNGGGASAAISLAENTSAVTTVVATDPEGARITYSLAGVDAEQFSIDATTGVVTFLTAPNFEAPTDAGADNIYNVSVIAREPPTSLIPPRLGLSDRQDLVITVTDANDQPNFNRSGQPEPSIFENNSSFFIDLPTDEDGDTLTYGPLGGADAALFTFNSTTGEVRFNTPPDFERPTDADRNNIYDLSVTVDDGTAFVTEQFAVSVLNRNEPVQITSNGGGSSAAISLAENTTAVTTVVASDPDTPTAIISYSISGVDAALFTINSGTGVLTFRAAPNFEAPADVGGDNVYNVNVEARALTGLSFMRDTQRLAITVTDDNDIPAFNRGGQPEPSIFENNSSLFIDLPTDEDGDTLTYQPLGGADAALFTFDSSTGEVRFNTPPDFERPTDADRNNIYDLSVTVSDGTASVTEQFAISVLNVNEPFMITSNGGGDRAAISLAEDTTAVTTVLASDPDTPISILTYSLRGVDAALFTIDARTGALSFRAAPDFENPGDAGGDNVYDVTVEARGLTGLRTQTDRQDLTITVTDANDAPVITSDGGLATAAITIDENTTAVTTVAATDPDLPAQALTYSIDGGADAAKFIINTMTGVLAFVAAPDREAPTDAGANNVYDVVVKVSDGTLSDTQAIAVTVRNVNEAPIISSNGGGDTAAISLAENTTAVTTVIAADPDGSEVIYSLQAGGDSSLFTIDPRTGVLAFRAAPDFERPADAGADNIYNVTVLATENPVVIGGSTAPKLFDQQALTISVTDVADGGGGGRFTPGNDIVTLPAGSPPVNALAGNDTIIVNAASPQRVDGGAGLDHFVLSGVHSSDAQVYRTNGSDPASQIYRLYDGIIGRDPDPIGFAYWVDQLDQGRQLTSVASEMLRASEMTPRWSAGITDAQFATLAYANILGRVPTTLEASTLTADLAGGLARGVALARLTESAEETDGGRLDAVVISSLGRHELSNVERVVFTDGIVGLDIDFRQSTGVVERLYEMAFDRQGDQGGVTYWTREVDAGLTEIDLAGAFLASSEAASLNSLSNGDFVTALYNRGLDRAPDAGGLAYWTGRVAADGRAVVLAEMSESPEHVGIVDNRIDAPLPLLDRYLVPGV